MDVPTTIHNIGGTLMVRIPIEVVKECGINKNMKVNAVNVSNDLIELRFNR